MVDQEAFQNGRIHVDAIAVLQKGRDETSVQWLPKALRDNDQPIVSSGLKAVGRDRPDEYVRARKLCHRLRLSVVLGAYPLRRADVAHDAQRKGGAKRNQNTEPGRVLRDRVQRRTQT